MSTNECGWINPELGAHRDRGIVGRCSGVLGKRREGWDTAVIFIVCGTERRLLERELPDSSTGVVHGLIGVSCRTLHAHRVVEIIMARRSSDFL